MANGESLVAFGEVAVEEFDEADLLRQVVKAALPRSAPFALANKL